MPRRQDLKTVMLIGSGPIVIGQACEFDYSGTQAARVLREEGFRVVLANSNPATIMTDPDFADATYIEPLDLTVLTAIIEKERPDALLATLGGQTALNLAIELAEAGVLERFGVELIGADAQAIETAENRQLFKEAMQEIGLEVPRSGVATTMEQARKIVAEVGLPVVIRPAFILGGKGTGIAATSEQFEEIASAGLHASPISEILIEESIAGWKELEYEVIRDSNDNAIIVCSIENFDAMGVHTGDSITVAPAQTLTDSEHQILRDAALRCVRRVGVKNGGSNVQFALNPTDGRVVIIEMNPRVSRSSALASKATGFPIAKISTRLAIGYTLDEIPNDMTGSTLASFEPAIDYVVTKVPRWAFEKFPGTSGRLGTSMQSVGEVMAIARTFPESIQKALRSLEQGRGGLNCDEGEAIFDQQGVEALLEAVKIATPDRPFEIESLLRKGVSVETLNAATGIDPWFLNQMLRIVDARATYSRKGPNELQANDWRTLKQLGFSDHQLGWLWKIDEDKVRQMRLAQGVKAVFKTVDTCAGEFESNTPYHYSSYDEEDEVVIGDKPKIVILGSGPNRIGQGIEFDYCCVHASFALREAGYETVMINCNPETVSTDYDTSDRLYFEPLTFEDVQNILDLEKPVGVVVSLGGQTPLKLAEVLPPELVLGTSPRSIDLAEDREQWNALCSQLEIPQPPGGTATNIDEAKEITAAIGYPALIRPSYVLGGRAMQIVYGDEGLAAAMAELADSGSLGREGGLSANRPVLIDRFLEDATEVDVDALRDASGETILGGIMEHVEQAGVHSGDSACTLPPTTLSHQALSTIEAYTRAIAESLEVVGLLNVQYAVKDDQVYVIEANPRASRTVPFVAKATGVPLAKLAARVMAGATIESLRQEGIARTPVVGDHIAVKEAVLPFNRFPEADAVLGPEMRSTGEVMGIDLTVGLAFAKSQLAAGTRLPESGTIFLSLADRDKPMGVEAATTFSQLGFKLVATSGTAQALSDAGLKVETIVAKMGEDGPNAVDLIRGGHVDLVINSPRGQGPRSDGAYIRQAAGLAGVSLVTTARAALAAANGMADMATHDLKVRSIQEFHQGVFQSDLTSSV